VVYKQIQPFVTGSHLQFEPYLAVVSCLFSEFSTLVSGQVS